MTPDRQSPSDPHQMGDDEAQTSLEHMTAGPDQELAALLATIPEGWSRTEVAGQSWGVTRTTYAGGKVISLNAERLGHNEQIGANLWITSEGPILRPCEVPAETVLQFFRAARKPTDQVPTAGPPGAKSE